MSRRIALAMLVFAGGCASSPTAGRRAPITTRPTTTVAPTTTSSTAPPTTTTQVPPVTTSSSVLVSSEDTSSVRTTAPPPVAPPPPAGGAVNHGRASWYARGARTANGERFEPDGLTYAHLSHAFGTMTRFCHAGRCVVARCNDRGPAAWTGRTIDLSRGAFAAIAPLGAGVVDVTWEAADR